MNPRGSSGDLFETVSALWALFLRNFSASDSQSSGSWWPSMSSYCNPLFTHKFSKKGPQWLARLLTLATQTVYSSHATSRQAIPPEHSPKCRIPCTGLESKGQSNTFCSNTKFWLSLKGQWGWYSWEVAHSLSRKTTSKWKVLLKSLGQEGWGIKRGKTGTKQFDCLNRNQVYMQSSLSCYPWSFILAQDRLQRESWWELDFLW